MSPVRSHPIVAPFAERLLDSDVPALCAGQRIEVVSFICRRVDELPSFTRFGVFVIGSVFRAILALPRGWSVARRLAGWPLPLIGEYPRLVRSLGYAYIWERWPETSTSKNIGTASAGPNPTSTASAGPNPTSTASR
ncbi:MAG: hypothetical protein ABIQ39_13355 [Ilumatobacteraceae bacterium]